MVDPEGAMSMETEQLEALSNVLTHLESSPYDIKLHTEHIKLTTQLNMIEQAQEAREMFTRFWPAGDEVWLPIIDHKLNSGLQTVNDAKAIFELLNVAEFDFLSIPLLHRHMQLLIQSHTKFNEEHAMFSSAATSEALASVVEKGVGHIAQSHILWDLYRDWELERLDASQGDARVELVALVDKMFLTRLSQPHSNNDETFQYYSSFTSSYKPPIDYERLLVSASKRRARAVKAWQRREKFENQLSATNYSNDTYDAYITFETKPNKPDVPLVKALYERAIADAAKQRFAGLGDAENRLRSLWIAYSNFVRLHSDSAEEISILQRGCRTAPGCGYLWANHIRAIERTEKEHPLLTSKVVELCSKALSAGLVKLQVDDIVEFVLAWSGQIMRTVQASDEGAENVELLLKVMEDGIAMVRTAAKEGDARFRLENLLSYIYEHLADSPDLATGVWEITAKHYKTSYLAWTKYADYLIKQERYDDVRKTYYDIVFKNVDWPEAIFDAWLVFEHMHGSVENIQACTDRIERAQKKVYSKRMEAANAAALENLRMDMQHESSSNDVVMRGAEGADTEPSVESIASGSKRKLETALEDDSSKKAKTDVTTLKRDRENCTVFVSNLPQQVTEEDLHGLFKDCGAIREIKITSLNASMAVATVEFNERQSVPPALTKDKKRVQGQSVAVHLAWRSTLYVTNFPEDMDDKGIRELFGKFGDIFDVRWPSKKFKSTRRFCYVQYTLPEYAEAALSLHQKELAPDRHLSVYISDPERKKERSDADADAKEVYVAGLSKFATREDLMKLFSGYGSVKDIRVATNDQGQAKGYAFVEFEDEDSARNALQANNHDLKNRRIAVTLADPRVRAKRNPENSNTSNNRKAAVRERSVRVKNLGSHSIDQEGVLQQTFEKIVPVKRVEIFSDIGEAVVELETVADAGKLLLLSEPLFFQGRKLQLSEEIPSGISASKPRAATSFVPRAAANRRKFGVGTRSKGPIQTTSSSTQKGQDDFRKMLI